MLFATEQGKSQREKVKSEGVGLELDLVHISRDVISTVEWQGISRSRRFAAGP